MAHAFSRTTRSLASETSYFALLVWGVALIMLCAWLAWFLFVKVTVYEVSQAARVEVERAAHPMAALVAGKIIATSMKLGRQVEAGEALVTLDSRAESLRLEEEKARLQAIPPQLEALTQQIADEEKAIERGRAAASSAIEQARWRHKEALSAARFAKENSLRLARLDASGRIAEIEALRARTEAEKSQAAADALASEINRLAADTLTKEHERRATLDGLRRDSAWLEGQMDLASATIARLNQDIEKHVIRAPVSGEIGETAPLDVGAFVDKGAIVGRIVPSGKLKVIAEFAPARVLGRMHPGQAARMRLDGFPWAQYGTIAVKVDRVAREIREGRVRVEFTPNPQNDSRLLQHGLPGSVEVEIERSTPAVLALRAAGQLLSRSAHQNVTAARPVRE